MARAIEMAGMSKKVLNAAYRGYKDGYVDFFGDRIEAMTGYDKQQFDSGNLKWTDLILEEDRAVAREAFVQALKGDKYYAREYRIRAANGNILWICEFSQIVVSEAGEIEFVAGHLVDITEDKEAELAWLERERKAGKYLAFTVAGGVYALKILKVKEIIGPRHVTPIPQAPEFVRGVIDLRGKVIPIVDLRSRLGLPAGDGNSHSCIIIVEARAPDSREQSTENNGLAFTTGIMVDSVSEVLSIGGEQVEDAPFFGAGVSSDWILGLAKVDGGVRILLDPDLIVNGVPSFRDEERREV